MAMVMNKATYRQGSQPWLGKPTPQKAAPRKKRKHCRRCGIVLVAYDPRDWEQDTWENGTQDGIHCTRCARQLDLIPREPEERTGWTE
jgi:hypothetical protein